MIILVLSFGTAGDAEKFERIFSKYKNLLLYKAYDVLHDYALAEDAVSEAFIRIYKNLDKIDDPESGRCAAFAVTIVRNTALTILKRQSLKPAEQLTGAEKDSYDLEADALSKMASDEIFALLNKISEEHRNVFILKYAYDLSNKEIGNTMGISPNHVGVLLHRAKKKLSALLVEEGYGAHGK